MDTKKKLEAAINALTQLFATLPVAGLENHNMITYAMMLLGEAKDALAQDAPAEAGQPDGGEESEEA